MTADQDWPMMHTIKEAVNEGRFGVIYEDPSAGKQILEKLQARRIAA